MVENETLTTLEGSRAAPRKACLAHAASVGAGGIGAWDLYSRIDAEAEGGWRIGPFRYRAESGKHEEKYHDITCLCIVGRLAYTCSGCNSVQ